MRKEIIISALKQCGCEGKDVTLKNNDGFLIYSTETIDNSELKSLYEKYYKDIYNKKERNIFRYFYYTNLQNEYPLHATIIMMNPAFADSEETDDTIENIKKFFNNYNKIVENNGKFGSFDIVNLYPVRMPKSAKLNELLSLTKLETNNYQNFVKNYIEKFCNKNVIIAAWGSKYNTKAKNLFKDIKISNLKCYAKNKSSPKHFGSMAFNTIKSRELLNYSIL